MYAVIESGGKQYHVELGSEIQVDRLDVKPGDNITLDRVLLVADGEATAVGRPIVDGAVVSAEVLRQERGEKVVVFKYKPKARTRVKKGARAELTRLRIAEIAFAGRSAAGEAHAGETRKAKATREAEKVASEKAAADQALAARLAAGEGSSGVATAEAETMAPARRASRTRAAAAQPEVDPAQPGEPASAAEPVAIAEPEQDAASETPSPASAAPEIDDSAEAEPAPQGGTDATDGETRKDD
jgi:large subunit ribosomal protein L21